MTHKILAVPCVTAFLSMAGCNRSSAPQIAPIPSLTVEELLANPQGHSHTMVKVSGCFFSGFESSVMRPCGTKNMAERIWVEDAAIFEEMPPTLPEVPEAIPLELRNPAPKMKSSAEATVLFKYDARQNSRAWQKLESLSGSGPMAPQVALLGQFETIAPRTPGTGKFGFGHLNAYTHELILVDVLDTKPSTTR